MLLCWSSCRVLGTLARVSKCPSYCSILGRFEKTCCGRKDDLYWLLQTLQRVTEVKEESVITADLTTMQFVLHKSWRTVILRLSEIGCGV